MLCIDFFKNWYGNKARADIMDIQNHKKNERTPLSYF